MNLKDAPFFAMLRERLGHLGERQRLTAENLANVSTPGFTPRDLDDSEFRQALAAASAPGQSGLAPLRSHPGHLPAGGPSGGRARIVDRPDSETTLDGNRVVLEDQLLRAGETRQAMETSLALYQKGLALIRLSARAPR